ncbi:NAD-dependent epimerase/dehydratase family protein [Membranicola marinus]|uniref:NAD-dependent epimerase/dehydratase family protein n=1 Tax=Membranihabitans marinus TaxID=1227546 RepID=A0A953HPY0_9BACT|nr:NAD-dependent epimerase/dehydratase family protein [Membranihabitans marinus]MBY5958673.1 NAD-dependent epimerase/dehydratase family protein [Membranihabitans marinus]
MKTIQELNERLSQPSERLIRDFEKIDGDIMILGVGGKMGPSLAELAVRASKKGKNSKRIIGVSRFSDATLKEDLEKIGVETITADLLEEDELQALPEVDNVIYMIGKKFGTGGNEHLTWAMNAYLPGRVAEKFRNSRIVVFSSGNIYPYVPVLSGGATESTPPDPRGEYAQSCLGRERIFEHFSHRYEIPMLIYRLNYAVEMRYGNLLEIATAVNQQKPINLRLGHMNVIWQGDANEIAIRSLLHCSTPPKLLNVTGPETISIRWVADEFGRKLGKKPIINDQEAPDALLNNAAHSHQLFGYPSVSLTEVMDWTADWVQNEGETLGKPTHFQQRSGKF